MCEQSDEAAYKWLQRHGFLYRYYSFPDDKLSEKEYEKQLKERIESIFLDRKLFFPSPKTFNDPFDCRAEALRFPETPKEKRKDLQRILKKDNPDLSCRQLRAQILHQEDNFTRVLDDPLFRDGLQETIYSFGVLCLSQEGGNTLMWSHYTNGHKGFCLKLDIAPFIDQEVSDFLKLVPVTYEPEYPRVPISVDATNDRMDLVVRTKAEYWCYEKEWRLIRKDGKGKSRVYPECALLGVILGCRISDEHKRLLTQWTQEMTPRPMLIHARRKKREFGLDFDLIDPETGEETPIDLNDLKVG